MAEKTRTKDKRKINQRSLSREESGHIKGEERKGERKRDKAEGPPYLCSEKFPKRAPTLKTSNAALLPSMPSEAGEFLQSELHAV